MKKGLVDLDSCDPFTGSLNASMARGMSWTPEFVKRWQLQDSSSKKLSVMADGPRASEKDNEILGEDLVKSIVESDVESSVDTYVVRGWKIRGGLDLSNIGVKTNLRFDDCEFDGELLLNSSHLLDLTLHNCQMDALEIERADIDGRLVISRSILQGAILNGSTVSASLYIEECRIGAKGLAAEDVRVGRNLVLQDSELQGSCSFLETQIQGDVWVTGCDASGQFFGFDNSFVGGSIRVRDSDFKDSELAFGSMSVRFRMEFVRIRSQPRKLFFTGSSVETLKDDGTVWPKKGGLHLDRFTYERLSVPHNTLRHHLTWLGLQPRKHLTRDFRSHPWSHLVAYLSRRGSVDLARRLAIRQRDRMVLAGVHGSMTPIFAFFGATCRYGLQPWLSTFWLLILICLGGGLLSRADSEGLVAPSSAPFVVAMETGEIDALPEQYPQFSPMIYSIDITLPFVDLAQERFFLVRTAARDPIESGPTLQSLLSVYLPIHSILGWLLTSLTVLSFSGLFQRRLIDQ